MGHRWLVYDSGEPEIIAALFILIKGMMTLGHLCMSVGRSWGAVGAQLGRSWAQLGAVGAQLGAVGRSWAQLWFCTGA